MNDSDYYLLRTGERTVYLQVVGNKRGETARVFEENSSLLHGAGLSIEKIDPSAYKVGCSMAALPNIGKGIELSLIE
jgi:hypothetical protein